MSARPNTSSQAARHSTVRVIYTDPSAENGTSNVKLEGKKAGYRVDGASKGLLFAFWADDKTLLVPMTSIISVQYPAESA